LFFSTLKSRSGTGEAFSFGLLTGATGSMLGLFWQFLLLSGTISSHGFFSTGNTAMGVVFAIIIVLVPVFVALWMFVYSAILNFLLVLVGGAKCGFEGSFKVVAYSHAASLLSFIPFVGGLAGMIWQLVIQTIGLKEIHGITYLRLFAAGLIPLALVAVLGMALVLLI